MASYYEVANWKEYQHYKDRNPPWVKLYFSLLTSESWVVADDAGRALMVAIILVASRNDGRIPANPEYVRKLASLNSKPNFAPLVESGFLVDASGLLAGCKHDASAESLIPTETEKDSETETEHASAPQAARKRDASAVLARFARFWAVVTKKVGKQASLAEFRKVNPDDELLEQMISAMMVYGQTELRYQKDPERWIKHRRWEDEQPAPTNGNGTHTPPAPAKPKRKDDIQLWLEERARIEAEHEEELRLAAEKETAQ